MEEGRLVAGGARCGGSRQWRGPSRSGGDPGCRMGGGRGGVREPDTRVGSWLRRKVQGGPNLNGSWGSGRSLERPGCEWGPGGGSVGWGKVWGSAVGSWREPAHLGPGRQDQERGPSFLLKVMPLWVHTGCLQGWPPSSFLGPFEKHTRLVRQRKYHHLPFSVSREQVYHGHSE